VQVTEGDGYYLGRVLINAQIAALLSAVQKMSLYAWLRGNISLETGRIGCAKSMSGSDWEYELWAKP
jgi:hypothetical protein